MARKGMKKGPGKGWHGEKRRHQLAGMGVSTVLPDGRRLDVSRYVAARGREWEKRTTIEDVGVITDIEIGFNWLDDYEGELNSVDREHIASLLSEGYVEGELCTYDRGEEHRGWWGRIHEDEE